MGRYNDANGRNVSYSKERNLMKRKAISSYLIYPFLLMLVIDLFSLGSGGTNINITNINATQPNWGVTGATNSQLNCLTKYYGIFIFCLGDLIINPTGWTSNNPLQGLFGTAEGFVIVIVAVIAVLSAVSISIFSTSLLNAASLYIIFLVAVVVAIWASLLGAGQAVFNTFPCLDYASTINPIISCASSSSTLLSIGTTIQVILSLSVAIGVLDLVAV